MPITRIGIGDNLIFFIISLILMYKLLSTSNLKVGILEFFALLGLAFFVLNFFLVNAFSNVQYESIDFLIGVRFLITNVVILYACKYVIKNGDYDKVIKFIYLGVIINFCYCILEEFFQNFLINDPIFHISRSAERLSYLLNSEGRNRMLWDEPSEAGVYMATFVLPFLYIAREKIKKIKLAGCLFIICFLLIFSKGSIIFLGFSFIVACLLNLKMNFKTILPILCVGFVFFIVKLYSSDDIYLVSIAKYMLSFDFLNSLTGDIPALLVGNEVVGASQTVRFARIYSTVMLYIDNGYLLPFGLGYMNLASFLRQYIEVVPPSFMSLTDFNLNSSRMATQSSLLELLVSFGVIYFFIALSFLSKIVLFFHREKKFLAKVIYINLIITSIFMYTLHFIVLLAVLNMLIEKYRENKSG